MTGRTVEDIQTALRELQLYGGAIDGIAGPKTRAAIRAFQRLHGLAADGKAGEKTLAELFPEPFARPEVAAPSAGATALWPRQRDVSSVFGPPAGAAANQGSVLLPAPMRIAWNLNQRIERFACHAKVAAPLTRIFDKTLSHYGEAEWRRLGLDLFGGCYNPRKMRGGSAWSMHAWGIAVDIDPERNQLKWGRDRAALAGAAYEPFWHIVESEGAVSLGRAANFDWMHFQFARL